MEVQNSPPDERRASRTQAVDKINPLTQDARDDALDAARRRIAGQEPEQGQEPSIADFERNKSTRFPPLVTRIIAVLCVLMLVAAFLPSAIRLHAVGFDAFAKAVSDVASIYVAALCIVLMAETGQVIFSLALATNAEGLQRIGLMLGAAICTGIALSGNAVAVGDHATQDAFAFLETFAPPILVLITAQILKTQMLHAIEDRHIAHREFADAHRTWQERYDDALRYWQERYNDAHHHADWMRVYANALREALRAANKRSVAVLRDLTDDDWRALIYREIATEQWFVRAESRAATQAEEERRIAQDALNAERKAEAQSRRTQPAIAKSGRATGHRTGELDGAVTDNADGTFTAACPHCDAAFTKDTSRKAMNALVAHQRHRHKDASQNVATQDAIDDALEDTEPSEVVGFR